MKLLKNKGTFIVLSKPENIIYDIAIAARTCYQSFKNQSVSADIKLVKTILDKGHHAMLEMADMKVVFMKVSRGFTHEMVRHRLCSFAQESTRYVDEKGFDLVLPPHRDEKDLDNIQGKIDGFYNGLRNHGWKPEDARQLLPIGMANEIVVKANIREWRHIFKMRCDMYAHWEIRCLMLQVLKWSKENIPLVFDDFKFFNSKERGEYARIVMSKRRLLEEIKHAIISKIISVKDLIFNIKQIRKEV